MTKNMVSINDKLTIILARIKDVEEDQKKIMELLKNGKN